MFACIVISEMSIPLSLSRSSAVMVNNSAIRISWNILCIDCIAPPDVVHCSALLPLACFRNGNVSKSTEGQRADLGGRGGWRAGGAGAARAAGAAAVPLHPAVIHAAGTAQQCWAFKVGMKGGD